ncbi:alpha/beta hydrolase family protein [Paenibacillus contaminans]|uniref:Dienelactone hydrolase domain-containing protein n=1 Tax=Paenibacillus contaminans TaxID=450362 RepID=A0A329MIJ7_9BACL|nr:dienelactone hydrolase family protein [Paenibacillus contaminans]RAV19624.1 hypothetical protein DQG23_19370 [Paenibacillus contaminans]
MANAKNKPNSGSTDRGRGDSGFSCSDSPENRNPYSESLYSENPDIGKVYRQRQKSEFDELIESRRHAANGRRKRFFQLDTSSIAAFEKDASRMRERLKEMLGWPLAPEPDGRPEASHEAIPEAKVHFVSEDRLGYIYRLEIEAGYGLTTYGLLFVPKKDGPHPLVISQHGGWGTPELCSGFYGDSNYNDMTRRVLKRGAAIFAPQLLLWRAETDGPEYHRHRYDNQLKQLGSSIAAVEIYKIQKALDYLISRPDVDSTRIGMIGLSYGGFYTMFTAALDTRIRAAYSSCFINDRFVADWQDFTWFDSGNTMLDAEICAFVAPRFLYLEAGTRDETFLHVHARREMDKVAEVYGRLNLPHRFCGKSFDGGHELDPQDEGIERFCRYLLHGEEERNRCQ